MEIDYAYLRRIIPVCADTQELDFVMEDWVKNDTRYFFTVYSPKFICKACYALYKNIAEAIIEQLGNDLIIVHDVDYIDSIIDIYFRDLPDIKDTLVRRQLSGYISEGAQILFSKVESFLGYGYFPNYLDKELKRNGLLGDDDTCIFVFGHTNNSRYAKNANYCNITYFLTSVFNPEVPNFLVDYESWLKTKMLRDKDLRYYFNDYYNSSEHSESWKKEKWNAINSSNEEKDGFILSYIEYYINTKNCFELLLEYDDRTQYFLGEDIFTDWEQIGGNKECDSDEYDDEDRINTSEYDEEYD